MSAAAGSVSVEAKSITEWSSTELYEFLYHLHQCSESAPEETRRLLLEQPEFARAIAQAQLKMGVLKPPVRSSGDSKSAGKASTGVGTDVIKRLDPEQQELLEQVQNLAPEVIQSLPPDERRQIMELREAMGLPPV